MRLLSQLAGITTLLIATSVFIVGEVVLLVVVVPLVFLRPSARTRILARYAHLIAGSLLFVIRHVGRAEITVQPVVPARGDVLMVMNHQSVIDIPAAVTSVPSGYPRMVARARYGRGIPLVSHMISLYGHILVQPGRTGRSELGALAETARASTLPILIFPEGHRTRDGEIGPWKRAGLETLLSARDWEVYVVVVDGLWRVARLHDFIRNLAQVRCRVEVIGPFRYDGRGRDNHDAIVDELRHAMVAKLSEMRTSASASRADSSLVLSTK
jgi:1-acyl-sn-glycerol-3-phosphate acyltransferase